MPTLEKGETEATLEHLDALEKPALPMTPGITKSVIGRIVFCKQPERDSISDDQLSADGTETAHRLMEEFRDQGYKIEQAFCDEGRRSRTALTIILSVQSGEIASIAELNPVMGRPDPNELVTMLKTKTEALASHLRQQIQIVVTLHSIPTDEGAKPSTRTHIYMTPPHVVEAMLEELIQPKDILTDRQSTVGIFAPGQYWTLAIHQDPKTGEIDFSIEHRGATYKLSPNGLSMITQATPLSPR